MKACEYYDNKTGKCGEPGEDSEFACPFGGDMDKCDIDFSKTWEERQEEREAKVAAAEKTDDAEEPEEPEDPEQGILKWIVDLFGEDERLHDALARAIDAHTKKVLAEAAWRTALALKHQKE